ncbi:MAG TPA: DUF4149 domain-containing protein [Vicinamibacterales bacterium]|nr:DUF4149 domain-containing protein [Vicinamibacterales bacterium]
MSLLRFASVALLAAWIGGLAALGFVGAPAIFDVLEAHDPVAGRTLAGAVFGEVFARFQHVTWGIGVLAIAVLGVRAALGPRPRPFALRMWTLVGMLAISLASALVIAPRIDRLRLTTPGTIASLPETDPRKIEFGRLHGLSTGLMIVTLLAGTWLIWAELRDTH